MTRTILWRLTPSVTSAGHPFRCRRNVDIPGGQAPTHQDTLHVSAFIPPWLWPPTVQTLIRWTTKSETSLPNTGINGLDNLKLHLIEEWHCFHRRIIQQAVRQWRVRLCAYTENVCENDGHFVRLETCRFINVLCKIVFIYMYGVCLHVSFTVGICKCSSSLFVHLAIFTIIIIAVYFMDFNLC